MISKLKTSSNKLILLRRHTSFIDNESDLIKSSIEKLRMNLISQITNKNFSYYIKKCSFSTSESYSERLYKLNKGEGYIRLAFRLNMLYIYTSSALFYLEMCNPRLGVGFGWLVFFFIANFVQKTAKTIRYNSNSNSVKISYLSYYKTIKDDVMNKNDLIGFSMSNVENFHFVKNRNNFYKKVYFSFDSNEYKINPRVDQKFREVMIFGTNQNYKNIDINGEK